MPGMGGVYGNENFRRNCEDWKILARTFAAGSLPSAETSREAAESLQLAALPHGAEKSPLQTAASQRMPLIRLAPITGGVENVGYQDERSFYFDLITAVSEAGIALSIGDGCPDEKILGGIAALRAVRRFYPERRAAVFIKPYENKRIFERIEWAGSCAELIGVDIDSYNIVTMRNLVRLEKKNAAQLREIRRALRVPFAVKGIFTEADVELVRELKPDVAVVSNHGGRIETRRGSTAAFLAEYGRALQANCGELWVDGGIRDKGDIETAARFGAAQVLVGRPFISALCRGGVREVIREARALRGL